MNKKREIVHLLYQINSIDDVIHSFSPEGYELLTDDFMLCSEMVRSCIRTEDTIMMEITGKDLDNTQREVIDRAVRTHYGLLLSEQLDLLKKCRIKIIWFLISFVISSILLFLIDRNTQELIIHYAYMPFWFFGYRILTFPIFDYLPMLKEKRWLEKLVTMQLIYTGRTMSEENSGAAQLSEDQEKNTLYRTGSWSANIKKSIVHDYFMDNGVIGLECNVKEVTELISSNGISGMEMVSDRLAKYLDQAVPFIDRGQGVKLEIHGKDLTASERKRIYCSLKNYFALRTTEIEAAIKENYVNILMLFFGFLISSLLLFYLGSNVGIVYHEFLLIMLWFFGDYLIEYVLLSQMELLRMKKKWETIGCMDITFSP